MTTSSRRRCGSSLRRAMIGCSESSNRNTYLRGVVISVSRGVSIGFWLNGPGRSGRPGRRFGRPCSPRTDGRRSPGPLPGSARFPEIRLNRFPPLGSRLLTLGFPGSCCRFPGPVLRPTNSFMPIQPGSRCRWRRCRPQPVGFGCDTTGLPNNPGAPGSDREYEKARRDSFALWNQVLEKWSSQFTNVPN